MGTSELVLGEEEATRKQRVALGTYDGTSGVECMDHGGTLMPGLETVNKEEQILQIHQKFSR
jgi:hypothetical protein